MLEVRYINFFILKLFLKLRNYHVLQVKINN